jgi:hypothetical protein
VRALLASLASLASLALVAAPVAAVESPPGAVPPIGTVGIVFMVSDGVVIHSAGVSVLSPEVVEAICMTPEDRP